MWLGTFFCNLIVIDEVTNKVLIDNDCDINGDLTAIKVEGLVRSASKQRSGLVTRQCKGESRLHSRLIPEIL